MTRRKEFDGGSVAFRAYATPSPVWIFWSFLVSRRALSQGIHNRGELQQECLSNSHEEIFDEFKIGLVLAVAQRLLGFLRELFSKVDDFADAVSPLLDSGDRFPHRGIPDANRERAGFQQFAEVRQYPNVGRPIFLRAIVFFVQKFRPLIRGISCKGIKSFLRRPDRGEKRSQFRAPIGLRDNRG